MLQDIDSFNKDFLDFVNQNIHKVENYKWKKINLKGAPCCIELNDYDNDYKQNKILRSTLNKSLLQNYTEENKYLFFKWYIANWGGVRSNKEETLKLYAKSSIENLIALKKKGIASWSKALSIVDPKRYFIYDARVASALNSIQIIHNFKNPIYFPELGSRNTVISGESKKIKAYNKRKNDLKKWKKLGLSNFYNFYLDLLKTTAEKLKDKKIDPEDIEMLLFSLSEALALEADEKLR